MTIKILLSKFNFLVREKSYERRTEEMLIGGKTNMLIAYSYALK